MVSGFGRIFDLAVWQTGRRRIGCRRREGNGRRVGCRAGVGRGVGDGWGVSRRVGGGIGRGIGERVGRTRRRSGSGAGSGGSVGRRCGSLEAAGAGVLSREVDRPIRRNRGARCARTTVAALSGRRTAGNVEELRAGCGEAEGIACAALDVDAASSIDHWRAGRAGGHRGDDASCTRSRVVAAQLAARVVQYVDGLAIGRERRAGQQ